MDAKEKMPIYKWESTFVHKKMANSSYPKLHIQPKLLYKWYQ